MVNMFLEQSPWVPQEGKSAIQDWVKAYKKGRVDFKNSADQSFKKVEAFFTDFNKQAK